jgi:hypothetical protein
VEVGDLGRVEMGWETFHRTSRQDRNLPSWIPSTVHYIRWGWRALEPQPATIDFVHDLEHWEQHTGLKLPGWGLFNTSVCKAGNRYVMAIEVGKPPEVVGVPFTMRFAESENLLNWRWLLLPVPHPALWAACPDKRLSIPRPARLRLPSGYHRIPSGLS